MYVNGIVLSRNNILEITCITKLLDDMFKIKDLGDLKLFLSVEVAQSMVLISVNAGML